jgi:predicted nucleotidyltransferase
MKSQQLNEIFQRAGVKFAYLFGSRARHEERPDSDIDVACWYAEQFDCMERFQRNCLLQVELEEILGKPLDLVILNDAKPPLQSEAVLRGQPLYPVEPEQIIRFEAMIRQRHEDYAYSQRFFTQARRQRLELP